MSHSNVITIVTFGTSLTNQNNWQLELENRLNERWPKTVNVLKFAQGGKTSRWGISQVPNIIECRPQIVLLEFLINDADVRHWLYPTESWNNHVSIINSLKHDLPNVEIYLMTMSPPLGVRRWLLRPLMTHYNSMYQDLSLFSGVKFIDIAPLWQRPGLDLRSLIPDGVHPLREAVLQITVPAIVKALTLPIGV